VGRPRTRIAELLRLLARHDVEHIVVGGVAAVLQGAPILTADLDVVHSRSQENVERILRALEEVHACYRTRTDRCFEPGRTELSGGGHQLLRTDLGDLDLLGTIGDGLGYEELLERTTVMTVAGQPVRVLDLAAIVQFKELLRREKDQAVLPILRRTLAERARRGRR
jgi:predicted nucleotidyltransferase